MPLTCRRSFYNVHGMETERKPTYEELAERVIQQDAEIVLLKQRIAELTAQVDKLTKMLFGKKSEKSKKNKAKNPKPPSDEPKQKRDKNGGGGRKPFPPEIPRRDVHVDLHPDECRCGECGKAFEPMGVEITEVLNFIPMVCEVIRFIRQRMKPACKCVGNKIIIAEMPIRTIDKG